MSRKPNDTLDADFLSREWAVFEQFLRQEDMEDQATFLRGKGIPVLESTLKNGDWKENVIIGYALRPEFWIEVPENRFSEAKFILREQAESAWAGDAVLNHPFADYTEDELREILLKEDYYGQEATVIARNLLLRSGKDIELKPIRDAFRERADHGLTARSVSPVLYLVVLFLGAIGGLVLWPVIFMACLGYTFTWTSSTQRDRAGTKYYVYDARSRVQGKVGIGILVLALLLGMANFFFLHIIPLEPVRDWLWLWR